jgi:hypothetical protein
MPERHAPGSDGDDPSAFVTRKKTAWKWTMLISQPPWITDTDIEAAKESALAKEKLPAIRLVHVVALAEVHFSPRTDST